MARDFFHTGLQLARSEAQTAKNVSNPVPPGNRFYVSRNKGSVSGDGSSWDKAFLTIKEAIAAVNLAYTLAQWPTRGRNTEIIVDEGWYGETPSILTASDCRVVGVAPGNHDASVLYGSATAGGFDAGAGAPALTIKGNNCEIVNMGLFTSDPLYPSLSIGISGGSSITGSKIKGCSFIRDVNNGSLGGILDYGADGSLIEGCFFSTSCKDYGVRIATNGVINPVNPEVKGCRFIGVPAGIVQAAGHNGMYHHNNFMDDTSDRPGTCDTPIVITATSGVGWENYAQGVNAADVVTGAGVTSEIRNWGDDS